jgi:hypothetical protein
VPSLQPLSVVHVNAVVHQDQVTGAYTVAVSLAVDGQGSRDGAPQIVLPDDIGPLSPAGLQLAQLAANSLGWIGDTLSPCELKAKLRTRWHAGIGDAVAGPDPERAAYASAGAAAEDVFGFDYTLDGSFDLTIDGSGGASASGPLTAAVTVTQPACTWSVALINLHGSLGVGYRAGDEDLVVNQLQLSSDALTGTAVCSDGSDTTTWTADSRRNPYVVCTSPNGGGESGAGIPAFGIADLTGSQELSGAVKDGTSIKIPTPSFLAGFPGTVAWDASLQLSYPGGQ